MRSYRPTYSGSVSDSLHDPLNGPDPKTQFIVQTEMVLYERLGAGCHRDNPALGLLAIRTTFAVNHEPVILPVNVVFIES